VRALGQRLDAGRVDAVAIEQLGGRGQDPFPGAATPPAGMVVVVTPPMVPIGLLFDEHHASFSSTPVGLL